jgi:hypothetical protein
MQDNLKPLAISAIEKSRKLLSSPTFVARHRKSAKCFIRNCKLTFSIMMLLTLQKSLKSIQIHLHEFFKEWSRIGEPISSATASAFTHARVKLSPGAFIELNERAVLEIFYDPIRATQVQRWCGHRLLGIDSSLVRLPKKPSLFKEFATIKCANQYGEIDSYPEGRISVLYDLLNHLGVDAQLVNSSQGELELAQAHWPKVIPDDILICDRGYAGYRFFAEMQYSARAYFVCRCSLGSFGVVQELFGRDEAGISKVVVLVAHSGLRGELRRLGFPLELTVRFVTVRLSTGELEVLATSLLNEKDYPTETFAQLYWKRWQIETYYGRLKGRLDLENFSGQTSHAVHQDFQAMVFLSNMETLISSPVRQQMAPSAGGEKQAVQVNGAVSLHALKDNIIELFASSVPVEQVLIQVRQWMKHNPVSIRTQRKVPRKKITPLRSYYFQRCVRKIVY